MNEAALVELLRDLVEVDSTSSRSNLAMMDRLEPRLDALGFTCHRLGYVDDAGVAKANLVAHLGPPGIPELTLVGHTDCVPFDPAWTEALILTERDGKLYGRGACDTKGFIAAAITAAARARPRLRRPVELVFTADEENGCVGAKKLLEARAAVTRRAIIGEPTGLTPVRANKGYCMAEVHVKGVEGHSAYPASGASAVFRAARLLARLERYSLTALRAEVDGRFEPPFATLNTGLLWGGKAKNIIPGDCRFTLEWRPLPSQPVDRVVDDVRTLIAECEAEEPGFVAELRPVRMDGGFDTPADADHLVFLEQLSGHRSACVAFGTEGPELEQLGGRPVVFGPGDIKVAHRTGEHVARAELVRAADILEQALVRFAGPDAA